MVGLKITCIILTALFELLTLSEIKQIIMKFQFYSTMAVPLLASLANPSEQLPFFPSFPFIPFAFLPFLPIPFLLILGIEDQKMREMNSNYEQFVLFQL
jgi:hypothetical protein